MRDHDNGQVRSAVGRGATVEGRQRPPLHRAHAVAAGGPRASQVAAWAFLAPVTVYLLVFYAYPLYRNIDLSLRNYTVRVVRQRRRTVQRVRQLPHRSSRARHSRPRCSTPRSSPSSRSPSSSRSVWRSRCSSSSTSSCPATLRALFLVPWLLPLLVSASTWSWMLNSDSGVVNSVLHARRHRAGQLAHLAEVVAGRRC